MKRLLWTVVAAATLLGFSACNSKSGVEPDVQGTLAFRPFVNHNVRAVDMDRKGLATDGFTVNAYGNNAVFFENVNVKPESGVDGFWLTQGQTYYWPNYELDFVAWANLGKYGNVDVTKDAQKINLTTPEAVANQVDVIAARNSGNRADNEGSGVAMTFKHLLSQIEVKAMNTNKAYIVKVAGVKIGRVNSEATFTYPDKLENKSITNSAYTDIPNSAYTDLSEVKSFGAGSKEVVTLGGTATSIMNPDNGNFRLIPQALTAWNQAEQLKGTPDNKGNYLGVLVNITNADRAAIYPTTAGQYAFAAVPFSIEDGLEAGKKYIITLDFSEGCGYEDPALTEGKPTDLLTDVTINDTPVKPAKPGNPILGGPIKFKVTVEDYVDSKVSTPMVTPAP